MKNLKNLGLLEIAAIVAGALILNKVLKTKVAIVGKTESQPLSLLDSLLTPKPVELPTTQTQLVKDGVPVVELVNNDIQTPFNTELDGAFGYPSETWGNPRTQLTTDYFN